MFGWVCFWSPAIPNVSFSGSGCLGNNPFGAASLWERVSGDAISAAISEKKNPPKEFQAHLDIPANASVEASKVERGSPTRILKNEC